MELKIISLINNQVVPLHLFHRGLTQAFTTEKEAEFFAKESRSYYYPALCVEGKNEEIIYCVPK